MINSNLAAFGAAADPTYRPLQPATYVPMTGNPATYGANGGEHLFFQNAAPAPIAPPTPAPEITNPMQAVPWWMQPQEDGGGDGGRNMMGGAQAGAASAHKAGSSNATTTPLAEAEAWDKGQKVGGVAGGALGLVGMLASAAAGQYARMKANSAFPQQQPIGFFEDIMRPDILFGSPLEILKERAAGGGDRAYNGTGISKGGGVVDGKTTYTRDEATRRERANRDSGGRESSMGSGRSPSDAKGSPF